MEHLKLVVDVDPVSTSLTYLMSPIPGSSFVQPEATSFVKRFPS